MRLFSATLKITPILGGMEEVLPKKDEDKITKLRIKKKKSERQISKEKRRLESRKKPSRTKKAKTIPPIPKEEDKSETAKKTVLCVKKY
ncbi:hypothetical protein JTB14_010482 [Gonioctena quinquepunctata]|nr:hypothetical protein JTB14_010482 [Gonioctena quinquepunctata]